MSHANRKIVTSSVLAVASAVALPAFGQTAPQATPQPQAARAEQPPRPAPPTPPAEPPLTATALLQSNHGSMLQASLVQQAGRPGAASAAGAAAVGGTGATGRTPSWNPYAVPDPEPRLLKKNDLIKIIVREESKSQTNGVSDQERQVDFDAKLDAYVKFDLHRFAIDTAQAQSTPEIKAEGQRDFKGTGEYDRSDTLTTRVMARVVDVKPNGTIVLQACSHLTIDEERIDVALSGTCREQDVQADDSILSTDLYDLSLAKQTTGQVHDATQRGLIQRILDTLNPF